MYDIRISMVDGSRILIQCEDKMMLWFTYNEIFIAPILKAKENQYLIVSEETPGKNETHTLSLFVSSLSKIRQLIIG